jgi:hypothetical protein
MYIVNKINFKTKLEIKNYVKDILNKRIGQDLSGDELEFIKELIESHEHKYDKNNVTNINVRYLGENQKIPGIYVEFTTKNKVRSQFVSIVRSVDGLSPIGVVSMDFIFPFGKYKGINIKDVDDSDYLYWILNNSGINIKYKIWIKQYMKYGFIPVNDHGFIDEKLNL